MLAVETKSISNKLECRRKLVISLATKVRLMKPLIRHYIVVIIGFYVNKMKKRLKCKRRQNY